RPLGIVFSSLDRHIPSGGTVRLIGALGGRTFRFKMAARFALVRRGVRPLSPGDDVRLGAWYELDDRRYDCTVYVQDGRSAPARGARLLARVAYRRTAGVSVWDVGCPRSPSR